MTLFAWSTPERWSEDQRVLPIIPNEIYFYIFEHLAPPTGRLDRREHLTFATLSCVCRLFANFCLPRTFEYLELSGPPERLSDGAVYVVSRATMLMSQITAKQPLALSLAQSVRVCHFTNVSFMPFTMALTPSEHLTGMSQMSNIRQLKFSSSLVDENHWRAIVSLASLEELCFRWCEFLNRPADAALEERVKIKVPRLDMTNCTGYLPRIIPVDARYPRALSVDTWILKGLDWLPQSALTELCIGAETAYCDWELQIRGIHDILKRAPHSIKVLSFLVDVYTGPKHVVFQRAFDTPAWSNFPRLRSLTLNVCRTLDDDEDILYLALDGISHLTGLESCELVNFNCLRAPMGARRIRAILQDALSPQSHLTYINVFGKALRLVDGEWLEVVDHRP